MKVSKSTNKRIEKNSGEEFSLTSSKTINVNLKYILQEYSHPTHIRRKVHGLVQVIPAGQELFTYSSNLNEMNYSVSSNCENISTLSSNFELYFTLI